MNLVSPNGASSVDWIRGSLATQSHQPLTWYKVGEQQIYIKKKGGWGWGEGRRRNKTKYLVLQTSSVRS